MKAIDDSLQVLIPQKLFLMASRAASYPILVQSLATASSTFDELTRCISIKVCNSPVAPLLSLRSACNVCSSQCILSWPCLIDYCKAASPRCSRQVDSHSPVSSMQTGMNDLVLRGLTDNEAQEWSDGVDASLSSK